MFDLGGLVDGARRRGGSASATVCWFVDAHYLRVLEYRMGVATSLRTTTTTRTFSVARAVATIWRSAGQPPLFGLPQVTKDR